MHGLKESDIAVIAPYVRQVDLIRQSLPDAIRLCAATVDSYQGCEREVVILSLTRSNDLQKVGFLADERRLNVAATRAKRQLLIIGDSSTLQSDTVLSSIVTYARDNGRLIQLNDLLVLSDLNIRQPVERAIITRGRRATFDYSKRRSLRVW